MDPGLLLASFKGVRHSQISYRCVPNYYEIDKLFVGFKTMFISANLPSTTPPMPKRFGRCGDTKKKGPRQDESKTFHMHMALVCKLVIAHSFPCFVEAIKGGMDHELFLLLLRGSFIHRSVKT
jgi:hypothetical protein